MSEHVIDTKPTVGTIFNASVYPVAEKIIKQANKNPETVIQSLLRRKPKPFICTEKELYQLLETYEKDEREQSELRRNNPSYWTI